MGRSLYGQQTVVPLSVGRRAGSLSNTISPGPRPISVPSGTHPTVWPQYTNVTRQRDTQIQRHTENGPIAYGEPFYERSPNQRKFVAHKRNIWKIVELMCIYDSFEYNKLKLKFICDTKIQMTMKKSKIKSNVSTGHKGSKELH